MYYKNIYIIFNFLKKNPGNFCNLLIVDFFGRKFWTIVLKKNVSWSKFAIFTERFSNFLTLQSWKIIIKKSPPNRDKNIDKIEKYYIIFFFWEIK
jgi:hypothetical protein